MSSPTSVNTDRWWSASECTSRRSACAASAAPRASIVDASRPSEKFGTDSSGKSTPRTLGRVKTYYDRRAPEYDDWWLGRGLYADRRPPGLGGGDRRARRRDRESAARAAPSTSPAARVSSLAICEARSSGSTPASACSKSRVPRRRLRRFVQRRCPFPAVRGRRVRPRLHQLLLLPPRGGRTTTLPRRGAAGGAASSSSSRPSAVRVTTAERWEERRLKDGSRWKVYKRVFEGEDLAEELGGELRVPGRAGSSSRALDAPALVLPLARLAATRPSRLPGVCRGRLSARVAGRS